MAAEQKESRYGSPFRELLASFIGAMTGVLISALPWSSSVQLSSAPPEVFSLGADWNDIEEVIHLCTSMLMKYKDRDAAVSVEVRSKDDFAYTIELIGPSKILSQRLQGYYESLHMALVVSRSMRDAELVDLTTFLFYAKIAKWEENSSPPPAQYREMSDVEQRGLARFQEEIGSVLRSCVRGERARFG